MKSRIIKDQTITLSVRSELIRGSKRLDCHADLFSVSRCRTRGESEESVVCRRGSTQGRDSPWLWNPEQMSPEVQNRGMSGPKQGTYVHLFLNKVRTHSSNILWIYYIFFPRFHDISREKCHWTSFYQNKSFFTASDMDSDSEGKNIFVVCVAAVLVNEKLWQIVRRCKPWRILIALRSPRKSNHRKTLQH